jgi:hypothetical protein
MAGHVPATHVFLFVAKTWMPGTIGKWSDAVVRTAMAGHDAEYASHTRCLSRCALARSDSRCQTARKLQPSFAARVSPLPVTFPLLTKRERSAARALIEVCACEAHRLLCEGGSPRGAPAAAISVPGPALSASPNRGSCTQPAPGTWSDTRADQGSVSRGLPRSGLRSFPAGAASCPHIRSHRDAPSWNKTHLFYLCSTSMSSALAIIFHVRKGPPQTGPATPAHRQSTETFVASMMRAHRCCSQPR